MTIEQRIKNLSTPTGKIDVVLDTDAYNEIDDQFAIAAPFHNEKSESYADGMNKSYDEIIKLLGLMGMEDFNREVYHGSKKYLPDDYLYDLTYGEDEE